MHRLAAMMKDRMAFFLGIDAGGTSTRAALADEQRVIGRAKSGSIKTMRVSDAQAEANLHALLNDLSQGSGVPISEVASTCVGIAGNSVSTVTGWVWQTLGPMLRGELCVCGDVDIALDAAFPGQAGVLVIAGTGSNILGRTTEGELVTVGGWGPALADEGSGHWIGQQALRAALRAHDAQNPAPDSRFPEPVKLLNALAAYWDADTLEQLVEVAHRAPPPDFAGLTRVVVQVAEQGDPLALAVLRGAGRSLGEDASLAIRKLQTLEPAVPRRVAFIGSVLEKIALAREAMKAEIQREHPGATVLSQAVDATEGALWRARQNSQGAP